MNKKQENIFVTNFINIKIIAEALIEKEKSGQISPDTMKLLQLLIENPLY